MDTPNAPKDLLWLGAGYFSMAHCVKLLQNRCNRTPLIICKHWYKWWLDATGRQTITWTNVDPDLFRLTWSFGRDETTFPEIRWHSGNHASHGTVFHYIITHAPVQTTDLRGLDWTCAIHSLIFMSVLNFSTNGMAALLPVLLFSMTSQWCNDSARDITMGHTLGRR